MHCWNMLKGCKYGALSGPCDCDCQKCNPCGCGCNEPPPTTPQAEVDGECQHNFLVPLVAGRPMMICAHCRKEV